VATFCTDRENHKYQSDYENSLILKRFIFEFCDFFLYLFYIAFYQLNMPLLRTNLVSVFMVDEFRRIFSEALLPWFLQNREKWQAKLQKKKVEGQKEDPAAIVAEKELKELEKDEHEAFDDYLEMIITFGYITLFAAAFPLASTISVVFIFFEARSDIFKLEKTLKRPLVHK